MSTEELAEGFRELVGPELSVHLSATPSWASADCIAPWSRGSFVIQRSARWWSPGRTSAEKFRKVVARP
jgi:hypothetical protein